MNVNMMQRILKEIIELDVLIMTLKKADLMNRIMNLRVKLIMV